MTMAIVIACVIGAVWLIGRAMEFIVCLVVPLVYLVVVGLLALLAGAVFGWGGVAGVLVIAALLWSRAGNGPPSTGRYGYGPGDIMPPSPKRSDGTPY